MKNSTALDNSYAAQWPALATALRSATAAVEGVLAEMNQPTEWFAAPALASSCNVVASIAVPSQSEEGKQHVVAILDTPTGLFMICGDCLRYKFLGTCNHSKMARELYEMTLDNSDQYGDGRVERLSSSTIAAVLDKAEQANIAAGLLAPVAARDSAAIIAKGNQAMAEMFPDDFGKAA